MTVKACFLAFPSMDLIDFSGPLETFSHARNSSRENLISVKVAGPAEEVKTDCGLVIRRDISYTEAAASLDEFDILVVPGSDYRTTSALCTSDSPIIKIVQKFAALPTKSTPRILLSVCSGAFFLGFAGVLDGRKATTHHSLIQELQTLSDEHGKTEVSRHSFVDGGLLENGIRVITSGGVTSGFDAGLYVIERLFGPDFAERARDILDYQWRRAEGVTE